MDFIFRDNLGKTKQQLVSQALEEWTCRNRTADLFDLSATAQTALTVRGVKKLDK
jgi:hypothetical protein